MNQPVHCVDEFGGVRFALIETQSNPVANLVGFLRESVSIDELHWRLDLKPVSNVAVKERNRH